MDAQKKKLVLALLAVVVLGAGYYFVFADSSEVKKTSSAPGVVTRKASAKVEPVKSVRKPKESTQPKDEPVAVERKERDEADTGPIERKKRRTDKKDEKMKKMAPAA